MVKTIHPLEVFTQLVANYKYNHHVTIIIKLQLPVMWPPLPSGTGSALTIVEMFRVSSTTKGGGRERVLEC